MSSGIFRCWETPGARLPCIGRYCGVAMLWHGPTKVGNYNEGIRIPEPVYQRLDARRTKTLQLFEKPASIPVRSSAT
ncbi:hypothetical protein AB4212_19845 [Streptomyces sp. 2MCAF27]